MCGDSGNVMAMNAEKKSTTGVRRRVYAKAGSITLSAEVDAHRADVVREYLHQVADALRERSQFMLDRFSCYGSVRVEGVLKHGERPDA